MKLYLDTSVLVKLYVEEDGSRVIQEAVVGAEAVVTSVIAYVEARSALVRKRHAGGLTGSGYQSAINGLDGDWPHYMKIGVTERLIRDSARLVDKHGLRAYDSIHLASAMEFRSGIGGAMVLAAWDDSLATAAKREGFQLLNR